MDQSVKPSAATKRRFLRGQASSKSALHMCRDRQISHACATVNLRQRARNYALGSPTVIQ